MTLLAPMTGTSSTGNATVASTSGTVAVPKNSYAIPLIGNELSKHVLLKTAAATNVTTSGTAVPLKAIFGNAAANLVAGTSLRWDPPLTGIVPTASIAAGGLTGGALASGRGSVKQIVFYEDVRGALNSDLMRSGIGLFPSLVLAWEESADRDEMGRVRDVLTETFLLFVVTSRADNDTARRGEGLDILEEATERLTRREACDGETFSSPAPLKIRRRGRLAYGPEHYVYFARFTIDRSLTRREPSDAADWTGWQDWETTSVTTTTDTGEEVELDVVDDAIHENT